MILGENPGWGSMLGEGIVVRIPLGWIWTQVRGNCFKRTGGVGWGVKHTFIDFFNMSSI